MKMKNAPKNAHPFPWPSIREAALLLGCFAVLSLPVVALDSPAHGATMFACLVLSGTVAWLAGGLQAS